ncbi:MAG: nucleotidyl transferase AbiEii/AbiGii toxin family protein [Alphaproteobacteria bacterium]|jgi:predicted nucleotidyltransferase component of viral defense system|nr:nucleotidyl transferase AbiEii/AbiGii toxin family protein [Alphaproteobacteria bacterium]
MVLEIREVGASVRARLLRISKEKGQNFELILTRYAIERLLYRLAQSRHADYFVLKGAMLLMTWFDEPFRATRDLDLLGFGDPAPEAVMSRFREVLGVPAQDGVLFDVDGVRISRIRENNDYGGLRVKTTADIGGARIPVNVDVAFGDVTEPDAETLAYPVLLDMPPPRLRGYARETVVAEKFQAMVALGMANSRMKDYYDLWVLSQSFDLERSRLARAMSATFARRKTAIPEEIPDALAPAFAKDTLKQQQWEAFKRDLKMDPGSLDDVIAALRVFLTPAAKAARKGA